MIVCFGAGFRRLPSFRFVVAGLTVVWFDFDCFGWCFCLGLRAVLIWYFVGLNL